MKLIQKQGKLHINYTQITHSFCIAIYNEFIYERDMSRLIDKRMFGEDLRNSKYFVEKGNNRFNNAKGQAYSYTLDLTSHNVVPYLQVWATNSDDLKRSLA